MKTFPTLNGFTSKMATDLDIFFLKNSLKYQKKKESKNKLQFYVFTKILIDFC